jgi:hypothetical protein
MIDRCRDPSGMEIVLLVGARPYTLPEQAAVELRDRIRRYAPDDRALGYLADRRGRARITTRGGARPPTSLSVEPTSESATPLRTT